MVNICDMKPLLIVKVGDTFPHLALQYGDFEKWICRGIGELDIPVSVLDPRRGDELPATNLIAGVVVTGSHAMVTDRAAWSETTAMWLVELVSQGVPVLGICYGHQLLAHALGGDVGDHPRGMEIGTVTVRRAQAAAEDRLFEGLPVEFPVQVLHRQTVLRLPDGAVLLASNDFETHQAFRFGDAAWGVQFHPEFSSDVMRGYLRGLTTDWEEHEVSSDSLLARITDTDLAARVLQRFGAIVKRRQS